MQSRDEYVRKINGECERGIKAERDHQRAIGTLALVAGGVVVGGAAGLNWFLAWHIDIRVLALMAFGWYSIFFFSSMWRIEKLKLRAQIREDIGWPLEELREQLQNEMRDMRDNLCEDFKHEIEMHEIRSR